MVDSVVPKTLPLVSPLERVLTPPCVHPLYPSHPLLNSPQVMRARYIRTGQEYAIKILNKNHLIRKEKMLVAIAEKNVLVRLGAGHPGIIHLHWTFQDEAYVSAISPRYIFCSSIVNFPLVFVLDLATNGEMQSRISRLGSLNLSCSRYYAAQIVDALQYMHDKDVIHRWVLHYYPGYYPGTLNSNH
jgi:serine/threonine protein kinase